MSPRVAYWLSSFEPDIEGVASEVACLRRAFPGSVAWGISPRHWGRLSWHRGFSVHPRMHLLFRGATWLLQGAFDVNHVFGGPGDWFHLKAIRRRPTVLTVALDGEACDEALLNKVDRFAVEWPGAGERLEALGIGRERIRLIVPPVDLNVFCPSDKPAGLFTVLFASSPERKDWLEARGVDRILDVASRCPEMRFRLLWRPWGDSLAAVQEWIAGRGLGNVELTVGRCENMAARYADAHATIAPFTQANRCKPAPNSVIESLACGRPVAVTATVGLSDMVRDEALGVVCEDDADSLAEGLRRLRADWDAYSARAAVFARREFGVERFVRAYDDLYKGPW
jgi:glycosyltransferase involved in cell wall biosynthesis